jgi:signal transduction histidine kinase
VLAGVWSTFVIPILIDNVRYPESDWRFAVLPDPALGLHRPRHPGPGRERPHARQATSALVMTSAAEGIITLTPEGRARVRQSQRGADARYEPAELMGRMLFDVIVVGKIRSGESDAVWRRVLQAQGRHDVPRDLQQHPDPPGERRDTGIVVTFTDITERRQVERIKDEFVSVVGHELRTPLTSIRGSLGLMAGGVFGELDEQGKRMLDIAVSNTDRLCG